MSKKIVEQHVEFVKNHNPIVTIHKSDPDTVIQTFFESDAKESDLFRVREGGTVGEISHVGRYLGYIDGEWVVVDGTDELIRIPEEQVVEIEWYGAAEEAG